MRASLHDPLILRAGCAARLFSPLHFLLVHASAVQLALAEGESVGCVNAVCNSRVGFDAVSQLHISRTLWTPILCYLAS